MNYILTEKVGLQAVSCFCPLKALSCLLKNFKGSWCILRQLCKRNQIKFFTKGRFRF